MTGLIGGGWYGAAFVNPYDVSRIFAMVRNANNLDGIVLSSSDGGETFQPDPVLTGLVTDSRVFPMGTGGPDGAMRALGSSGHERAMGTVAHMAFNRDITGEVVVASPFTGVFYANLGLGCFGSLGGRRSYETSWKNLSGFLPRPLPYCSSAAMSSDEIFVATEGRGIFRIAGFRSAPPATYFAQVRLAADDAADVLAVLRDSLDQPVPYARILVRIDQLARATAPAPGGTRPVETRSLVATREVRTDADGQVLMAGALSLGKFLIELNFPGDGRLAPSHTAFVANR